MGKTLTGTGILPFERGVTRIFASPGSEAHNGIWTESKKLESFGDVSVAGSAITPEIQHLINH